MVYATCLLIISVYRTKSVGLKIPHCIILPNECTCVQEELIILILRGSYIFNVLIAIKISLQLGSCANVLAMYLRLPRLISCTVT
jgi:hypothetical protein